MHAHNHRHPTRGGPPAGFDPVHLLASRALGGGGGPGAPAPPGGRAFTHACASDEALVRRLAPVSDLATAPRGGAVYSCAWSPGGSLLAATGEDHRVRVFDIAGGSQRAAAMDVVRGGGREVERRIKGDSCAPERVERCPPHA